ncbi:MAG TPA: oligopeptide transporter, OPT family [Acidobacteriota bacterium]|jgi:putative OPT family oligopeptide transporter|nr:oligopeptide transporter, OPT family [Acidobacteriota bacterium]
MAHKEVARAEKSDRPFQPYVATSERIAEFTLKAIILGAFFGIVFGASTVYLALRAGLTVSASIPIAVLAIAVFKKIGRSTILENNIVQTIGSAGESIAAGVVFTVPALYFLQGGDVFFHYTQILILALVGGILGVLFMIPLRRSLIVKEHGVLPYPEGTACADVLIAGEKGGTFAKRVFQGLGMAILYKFLMSILGLWKDVPAYVTRRGGPYPNATINGEITPEYLGVGYIIGPSIAGTMVAGGVLSWLVLIPLITFFGDSLTIPLKPGSGDKLISAMTPIEIYRGYVRYIGAGAVAASGVITLLRSLPTIISSFRDSLTDLKSARMGKAPSRTEKDIPITYVLFGSAALALLISVIPQIPGTFPGSLLMSVLIVVFGFFFVTVSSRIVGIIGSSSNPISGMTIATLMATCLIFVSIGWSGNAYQAIALCVGAIVCIAAANAGATSQDLKTGYLVGSTPLYQQLGLIIGVLVSVLVIGKTLLLLHTSPYGPIGSPKLAAPQATLMSTIIKGMLSRDLPWGLVFTGMFISSVIELCGVRSLSFAVGSYLPLSTTSTIFVGGIIRWLADRVTGRGEGESELTPGMLYSTGLVAGGSLAGVAIAVLAGIREGALAQALNLGARFGLEDKLGVMADLIALVAFAALGFILYRVARKKEEI